MMIYTCRTHLSFISLENTKQWGGKVIGHLLLLFTGLLVSSSHKGAIYDGDPRKPREFYARGGLISLSYLNLALLKVILTTANLGPHDFVASP